MSDLNYYAPAVRAALPHRAGLIVWGVVMIVVGAFFVLSGLMSVAGLMIMGVASRSGTGHAIGLMAVNLVMTGGLGAGLIWLGIGCCRGHRWVRPLLVAGGSVAVVSGLVSIVPGWLIMSSAMSQPATAGSPPLPKAFWVAIRVSTLAFSILFLIVLPAVLVAWFRRPSVGRTLAAMDPKTRWTDAVPMAVLGWTLACLWLGGTAAAAAAAGLWFWFTTTLVGWPALVGVVLGLAVVIAGFGCSRRSATAWAASVALLGLMAASAVTFVTAGDTAEYQRQMAERTNAVANSFAPPPPTTGPRALVTTFRWRHTASTFAGSVNPQLAPAML